MVGAEGEDDRGSARPEVHWSLPVTSTEPWLMDSIGPMDLMGLYGPYGCRALLCIDEKPGRTGPIGPIRRAAHKGKIGPPTNGKEGSPKKEHRAAGTLNPVLTALMSKSAENLAL